ncbi:MAG: pyridoxal phosphate-dependent aminotransferase [Myxococcota bacterium]
MFSRRSDLDGPETRLARALAEARADGRPLLDLTESNPTRAGLPYDAPAIRRAIGQPDVLRYEPHPLGTAAARRAVATHVGAAPERVMLTAGTSEAYAFLFKLLCDPGDEVLVPRPSYPLLEVIARVEAVRLVPYRLAYDGEWHVDLGSLRAARTRRTRAVVTVCPNNPTGSYLGRDELRTMAELGLPIVSDEVFAPYALEPGPGRVRTVRGTSDVLVFSLGGLSKEAGLPQMKLAWAVVSGPDRRVAAALGRLEHIADAFLSVGTPVQLAAGALLQATEPTRAAIRQRTRRNLAALRSAVGETSPVSVLRVEGGWYAVLRIPTTLDEEAWALALLSAGVVAQPGWLYDFESEAYLVVSLLTPEDVFDEGIGRLLRVVDEQS